MRKERTEQERVEEGEIDPHTPLFINITYTKKKTLIQAK